MPADWESPVRKLQDQLKCSLQSSSIKWVAIERMHVTMRFLGSTPSEEVALAKPAIDTAATAVRTFSVRAGALGRFPQARRPRVIWLAIYDPGNQTRLLQQRVIENTARIGEPPDLRAFTPH